MRPSNLAVLTTYFDPLHRPERIAAWKRWNAGMVARGIHPLTIEGTFPQQESVLCAERGSMVLVASMPADKLCQKESLLNLAIRNLPSAVDAVCWCDADVLIDFKGDWQAAVLDCLGEHEVCQPWSSAQFLGPLDDVLTWFGKTETLSAAVAVSHGLHSDWLFNGHAGLCWAATRHWLDMTGGLYANDPLPTGDLAMAAWLLGLGNEHRHLQRSNDAVRADVAVWGQRAVESLGGRGVGFVPGAKLNHLWHGPQEDRKYGRRGVRAARIGFDPSKHLRRESDGLLRWSDEVPLELVRFCAEMMEG